MKKETLYKDYTIRIEPYDQACSHYSYVIIDPQGKEIKHVAQGGDTEEIALENAKKMIDFEVKYQEAK